MKRGRIVGFVLAGVVGVGLVGAAGADAVTGNPWPFTMSNPSADGIVVTGVHGSSTQALLVKDWAGNPIFGVGQAGGAAVYGDDFRVLAPTDIFHGQITVSAAAPNPAVCVRAGQVWIGGPGGNVWRCTASGGSFTWTLIV